MRRLRLAALRTAPVVALMVGAGQAASALSLTLAGPAAGPLAAGIGAEVASVGSQLQFSIGLDLPTAINGYDVTIAWDADELAFDSATAVVGLPFSAPPGAGPETRVAAITLTPVTTSLLFLLSFDVLAVSADGFADVSVFVNAGSNGTGIAPGSLSLANPTGAGIDVVPEPASAALLALGLTLLAHRGRGQRRDRVRAPPR